jgi:hypothetical protein
MVKKERLVEDVRCWGRPQHRVEGWLDRVNERVQDYRRHRKAPRRAAGRRPKRGSGAFSLPTGVASGFRTTGPGPA